MTAVITGLFLAFGCDRTPDPDVEPVPATQAAASSTRPAADMPAMAGMTVPSDAADTRTVSIVLPHDEPAFPDGPGRGAFLTSCIVCHSPRYVTMQPNFSGTVWMSEVHKMVTEYGAHVTPEQQAQIVQYIMTIRGAGLDGGSTNAVQGGSAK